MDLIRLMFSGFLCGLGVAYGGAQLLRGPSNSAAVIWEQWDTAVGARRRRRRRRLGAAIIVLVSLTFFVGVNFLSPGASPLAYLVFWLTVIVLILWLCGLAMADLIAVRRVQQKMLASMRDAMTKRPEAGDGDMPLETNAIPESEG